MTLFRDRPWLRRFFGLAMAFSAQLLPILIDLLFLRRGTRAGAIAGLALVVSTPTQPALDGLPTKIDMQ